MSVHLGVLRPPDGGLPAQTATWCGEIGILAEQIEDADCPACRARYVVWIFADATIRRAARLATWPTVADSLLPLTRDQVIDDNPPRYRGVDAIPWKLEEVAEEPGRVCLTFPEPLLQTVSWTVPTVTAAEAQANRGTYEPGEFPTLLGANGTP